MQKTVKHTENYVGTFPQNAHVAQCQNCHYVNSDILERKKYCEENSMKWDNSEQLSQEWYQRKTMTHISGQKMICENGYTKISQSFWICQECADQDGDDFGGDVEAWNASGMGTIDTPTGTSEIIHTEILN